MENSNIAATVIKCLRHCQSRLDDVAATIQLRGGKKEPAKPVKKVKAVSEKANIETLSEQQAWLRKSIAEIKQNFGNTAMAKRMKEEMENSLQRVDELLNAVLKGSTFQDSLMSDKLLKNAKQIEKFIKGILGDRFESVSVSPIDHFASDGKSYSTILISFKDVNTDDKRVMPWLVFSVSETQERQLEKRRYFLTAMSTPNTTFTPRSEFKSPAQMERLIQMYLTGKNISMKKITANKIPATIKINVKGLTDIQFKNGRVIAKVEKGGDPKTVGFEGAKAIMSAVRKIDPKFSGNIQYVTRPGKGKALTELEFLSTTLKHDNKVNDKKTFYRVDESKLLTHDVAGIDPVTFFNQLGKISQAMLGAKNVVRRGNDEFTFMIGKNPKRVTHVKVNLRADLYNLEFLRFDSKSMELKSVYKEDGVYAAQLSEAVFRGTGLHTSLSN